MYADLTVSFAALAVLLGEFIFSVGVPVVLLIVWRKKTDVSFSPAVVGAIAFLLLAMAAEQIIHFLFLGLNQNVSDFILGRPWLYVLYSGLVAGLIEESGRLLVFKKIMRKDIGRENAVMYGIGYGGMDCILVLGLTAVSNFFVGVLFNRTGAAEFMAQYSAEDAEIVAETIRTIGNIDVASVLLNCMERLFAIVLQIELSVLVFAAVRTNKLWMYPLAILAHMFVESFTELYQIVGMPLWMMELLMLLCVAALGLPILRLYNTLPSDQIQPVDRFGRPIKAKR